MDTASVIIFHGLYPSHNFSGYGPDKNNNNNKNHSKHHKTHPNTTQQTKQTKNTTNHNTIKHSKTQHIKTPEKKTTTKRNKTQNKQNRTQKKLHKTPQKKFYKIQGKKTRLNTTQQKTKKHKGNKYIEDNTRCREDMNFMFEWQEHKIHIFEPTCNVLFIIWRNQFNKSKRRES